MPPVVKRNEVFVSKRQAKLCIQADRRENVTIRHRQRDSVSIYVNVNTALIIVDNQLRWWLSTLAQ